MGCEIDFQAVGEESKGGDAISLRWGELNSDNKNEQFIVVIDSGLGKDDKGNDDTKLVDSIWQYYGTKTIDLVVSTHPDADHIKGLSYVLDIFEVKKLWMHLPWNHSDDIAPKFPNGKITSKQLKEACEAAWELYKKAIDKKIPVEEPFSCKNMTILSHGGQLKILGPTKEYYEELLPEFHGLPKPTDSSRSVFSQVAHVAQQAGKLVKAFWGRDSIDDKGKTTARNNSSVILELSYDSKRFIFTGDAGIPALEQAVDKVGNDQLEFIQIPHHGSKRNVGPMVLDRIVGYIVPENEKKSITAVVSCPKENPKHKHPNKGVLNAFTQRGCGCYPTGGSSFWYPHGGTPHRTRVRTVPPCEFYREYKDDS